MSIVKITKYDGFVDMWRNVLRYLFIRKEHLDRLVECGYVIIFDDDLLLISDRLIHNKIRKDRYVAGQHSIELASLQLLPTGRYIKD